MKRTRGTQVVALAVLLLTTAGCGARWSEDQRAAVEARRDGGAVATGSGVAGGARPAGSSGPGAAGGRSTGQGTGGGTAGGAPTDTATGGGGGGEQAGTTGSLPCAAPSDAPGVTETEITLGNISSLSGPVPGLGTSAQEAVRSYVAYRNANGGVCGRQLALRTGDDGTDNGRHRALVQELDPQVIGIVGGVGGGDAGSADTVAQLGMPVVVTAISEQFQDSATVFDVNPPFADVNAVIGKYRFYADQGVRTAAVVYLGVDQTRSEIIDKQIPQMQAAGIEVVLQLELPLSTLSYDSAARQVANSEADYLLFLADYTQSASMARSMADTGYQLQFAEYVTAYGAPFPDLAGAGAEGAVSWIRNLPNEEPGSNPEQTAFLEWMAQTAPDAAPDTFAADSWAAAKAMVDAMEALPGPITREALLAQLHSMNEYDAGGFIGTIQLGNKLSNGCFVAMRYEGDTWRRVVPAQGFLC
jgi:ABC-type branched-subunit amino acid transport system substrate-binding protein